MPRSLAALALIIFLSLSTAVSALSIGEIELNSALNQPFSADVPLTASQGDELDSLDVRLASQEAFEGYGIDRPEFLRDIIFKVRRTGAKEAVLEMRGNAPVSEPFVTLLVKFTWSAGNLLREYTVLLDPPTFSRAGKGKTWRASDDLPELVAGVASVVEEGGWALVSTNFRGMNPGEFASALQAGLRAARRDARTGPAPMPPESRGERYLNAAWIGFR